MVAATGGLAQVHAEHAILAGHRDVKGPAAALISRAGKDLNIFGPAVSRSPNPSGLSVGIECRGRSVERQPDSLARAIGRRGDDLQSIQLALGQITATGWNKLVDVAPGGRRCFGDAIQVSLRVEPETLMGA